MYDKIFDLYGKVLADKELPPEKKEEMFNEIRKITSPIDNRWNFRWVIFALALVALAVPVYALSHGDAKIPDALLSIAATAIGALAGLLTRMSKPNAPDAS